MLRVITPPATEPVDLPKAKQHLRVDIDDDDDLIYALVGAARETVEGWTARSLITTAWRLTLDGFVPRDRQYRPAGSIPERYYLYPTSWPVILPRADVIAVTSIPTSTRRATRTLDPSQYQVVTGAPGFVLPAYGLSWPATRYQPESVTIDFTAGYGDTAADVPNVAKSAIKLLPRPPLREPRGHRDLVDRPPRGAAGRADAGGAPRLGILPLMGRFDIPTGTGAKRHRITLQTKTKTRDDYGQVTTAWASGGTYWALVEFVDGQQVQQGNQRRRRAHRHDHDALDRRPRHDRPAVPVRQSRAPHHLDPGRGRASPRAAAEVARSRRGGPLMARKGWNGTFRVANLKVVGDREVRAALRALGTKIRREIVVKAMDEAMGPMHRAVVAEAPVDSGNLAHGVIKEVKGEEKGRMKVEIKAKKDRAPYLGPVEFGVKSERRDPDEFMLRAFDRESKGARDAVERLISEGVDRKAGELA
jgi:HK97 gp10 family phage protein